MEKSEFINPPYGGELLPYERYKLYSYVKKLKPNIVLELGTGIGGSTYYMASALKENNNGVIYTCDPFKGPSNVFIQKFKGIMFYEKKYSNEFVKKIISDNIVPNFMFFDQPGLEIPLEDFKLLKNVVNIGTVFSMHDWDENERAYDGGLSKTSSIIKPYLFSLNDWELIEELSGTKKNSDMFDSPPDSKKPADSVGMCFFKKIK